MEELVSGYDLLSGIVVLEVAHFGPSALGGYLADMGADVVKVEGFEGDPVRSSGPFALGQPDGPGFLHLRWNRGKHSLCIDLKSDTGQDVFKDLAAKADVVIEGMRAGVLDRLGLGYEVLRGLNAGIVFCSVSGFGSSGPYSGLESHGPSFDAFGGLGAFSPYSERVTGFDQPRRAPVGMHAVTLHAALGTLSAVIRAQRTGQGAYLEVAAVDSAAHWLPNALDPLLNEEHLHARPGFTNAAGKMALWPMLNEYGTSDDRFVFFMGRSAAGWAKFCSAVDRPDLAGEYAIGGDDDEALFATLSELFATRTRDDWTKLFTARGVPCVPVNSLRDLV